MNNVEFYTLIIVVGILGVFDYVSALIGKKWSSGFIKLLLLIFVITYLLKAWDDIRSRQDFSRVQNDFSHMKNEFSGVHRLASGKYDLGAVYTGVPIFYNEKHGLSYTSMQKGDFTSALNFLDEAAKLDTKNDYIDYTRTLRAQILIYRNDIVRALDELTQLDESKVDPTLKESYFKAFIYCYQKLNSDQKANEYVEKLIDLHDPVPAVAQRTKDHGCAIQESLPDKACTPGAIFPEVKMEEICASGYVKSVRNISKKMRGDIFEEYGIRQYNFRDYEEDYLIPRELGGSNNIANLWPEAALPLPGFHEKNKVEKYLYNEVCAGRISLARAQKKIANNWLDVYKLIE